MSLAHGLVLGLKAMCVCFVTLIDVCSVLSSVS